MFFFFFKQKTAYEMRISDWSSDVCSSDLDYRVTAIRRARAGAANEGNLRGAATRRARTPRHSTSPRAQRTRGQDCPQCSAGDCSRASLERAGCDPPGNGGGAVYCGGGGGEREIGRAHV